MNYKLIKLTEGYIIVSDEEIIFMDTLKPCYYLFKREIYKREYSHHTDGQKIIASTFIPELPKIDFNNLEQEFGIVDIEKLKDSWYNTQKNKSESYLFQYNGMVNDALEAGIKIGLKLNKDKLYTEEDLREAIKFAQNYTCDVQYDDNDVMHEILKHTHSENMIIQSLQPKTEWNIKIETEVINMCGCSCHKPGTKIIHFMPCCYPKHIPKIINNSIKILKNE